MNDTDKYKLYFLTGSLDIGLIYVLTKKILPFADKTWIFSTLLAHGAFFHALKNNNRKVLDILHYFIFVLPVLSTFTKTIYPKILSLFLLLIIQFLWVIENRCILNEKNQTIGFGDYTCIGTITLNTILSFQIGKMI